MRLTRDITEPKTSHITDSTKNLKNLVNTFNDLESSAYFRQHMLHNRHLQVSATLWRKFKLNILAPKAKAPGNDLPSHLCSLDDDDLHELINIIPELTIFFRAIRFVLNVKTVASASILLIIKSLKSNAMGNYQSISLDLLLLTLETITS